MNDRVVAVVMLEKAEEPIGDAAMKTQRNKIPNPMKTSKSFAPETIKTVANFSMIKT
jgi:hypothetical protein